MIWGFEAPGITRQMTEATRTVISAACSYASVISVAREGTVVLPPPATARDGTVTGAPDAIVAFVQQGSKEIVAAARVDLPRS